MIYLKNRAYYRESEDIFGYTRLNDLDKLAVVLKEHPELINTKEDGLTALHIASDRGYLDVVKALIDAGADINIKTDDDDTALHLGNCSRIGVVCVTVY
jgi:ankyrin repeat protein